MKKLPITIISYIRYLFTLTINLFEDSNITNTAFIKAHTYLHHTKLPVHDMWTIIFCSLYSMNLYEHESAINYTLTFNVQEKDYPKPPLNLHHCLPPLPRLSRIANKKKNR